jgi:hypothetical protein
MATTRCERPPADSLEDVLRRLTDGLAATLRDRLGDPRAFGSVCAKLTLHAGRVASLEIESLRKELCR